MTDKAWEGVAKAVSRVAGKTAIVTGAASGSGEATARLLAANGAQVVVADINGPAADDVASSIRSDGGTATPFEVDMGDPSRVQEMVEYAVRTYHSVDILHNNASDRSLIDRDLKVADVDLDVWNRHIAVDLTGPMLASKFAIPHMLAAGGGSIIHTSSIAARLAQESRTAYGAAKAGLLGLSVAIATQYGKQGIRSNVIAPGAILSPALKAMFSEEHLSVFQDFTMTPQIGTPADIAAVALFLASDESRYINGQVITVDGGLTSYVPVVPVFRRLREEAG